MENHFERETEWNSEMGDFKKLKAPGSENS